MLRAYAKYMRQGGTPFAQDYIEDALKQNVDITRLLVALFEARFDPGRNGQIAATPRRGWRAPTRSSTGSARPSTTW